MNLYFEKIKEKMEYVMQTQEEKLAFCAEKIADSVIDNGILHVFGTGHSHMMGEELFYRAGGLGPVNAILEPALMLHEAAELGTQFERMEGIASFILRREDVRAGDVLIVCSNSGRNSAPIEMAMLAKDMGVFVIGLGSGKYADVPSRHSSGLSLSKVVDLFLDNDSDLGDAAVPIGESGLHVGATSTVIGAMMLNDIIVRVAQLLQARGEDLPFFISANGAANQDAYNGALMDRYRRRVRSF